MFAVPPPLPPPRMSLRENVQTALGDSYSLERELGGGGMSRAFLAAENALGRQVVVKVLDSELAAGISAARFLREIRTTAGLQHPNIVPVLSAGEAAGLPYYTMPYIAGASLRERLARGPLARQESCAVLRDVARALAHAHAQGIVHRDVKPDNVLLSGDAGVVTDFGIAKAISASRTVADAGGDAQTALGTALGTPRYIAPEQAAGDAVDGRTDIYAWGVMAYELFAGAHPFGERQSAQQFIAAHMTEVPPPLASRAGDVPEPLAALVDRCLEKDPARRPQSAAELVAALDDAARSGATARARRGIARSVPRMIGAALAAAVLVAGGVVALRHRLHGVAGDPGVIAVLPFRVASADPSLRYLREGILDLIGAQLIGTPRTADARAVLAAWRRAGGDEASDLLRDDAVRVAQSVGAGRVVQGDIVGPPERITISATVYDVQSGRERARVAASGPAARLPVLLDSIVRRMLVLDAGEDNARSAQLARIPLPALQAYLAGQAAHRRGRYAEAVEAYWRAVQIDSTFALAGYGLSVAAGWTFDARGVIGRAIAVRHADALGVRDRLLLGPSPDSQPTTEAAAIQRDEEAVQAAPDVPELWYHLGDRLFHYGELCLDPEDAHRRSVAAFERARALDPSFVPALEHLPLLYATAGDSARSAEALRRITGDSAVFFYHALRLVHATNARDRDAELAALRGGPVLPAVYAAMMAVVIGDALPSVEPVLHGMREQAVTEVDRQRVDEVQYLIALSGGRPAAAARIADRIPSRRSSRMVDAVFWEGDSLAGAQQYAADLPTALAAPPLAEEARRTWVTAVFDVAQYELARGETTHVRKLIATLRGTGRGGSPVDAARPARLAIILDAQLAALSRAPSASSARQRLDSLLDDGPLGARVAPVGNLVLARLLERAGNRERALAVSRRSYIGNVTTSVPPGPYLLLRARLAAQLGRRNEAIRAYRHYLALHYAPEPSRRASVSQVRKELERIIGAAG